MTSVSTVLQSPLFSPLGGPTTVPVRHSCSPPGKGVWGGGETSASPCRTLHVPARPPAHTPRRCRRVWLRPARSPARARSAGSGRPPPAAAPQLSPPPRPGRHRAGNVLLPGPPGLCPTAAPGGGGRRETGPDPRGAGRAAADCRRARCRARGVSGEPGRLERLRLPGRVRVAPRAPSAPLTR